MSDWEVSLARARQEFIEGLARRGFTLREGSLHGHVEIPGHGSRRVEIRIPMTFPYRAPKVRPIDRSGDLSWHREPEGWLCLYAEGESSDLPWKDAEAFIERTIEWFEHDLAGWVGDPPDLDLDRYFPPADGFVIYRDLEGLLGKPIRAKRRDHGVIEIDPRPASAPGGRRRGDRLYGWAEDLGELNNPIRDWDGLAAILGERADFLARRIHRGEGEVLLLRYRRGSHVGAMALLATSDSPVQLRALRAADAGEATLRLRAGTDASLLRERSVAIIGLGAVGSFLADLLARGGIGNLELWDGDRLRPGNSVRHLAGVDYAGWPKSEALANLLIGSGWMEEKAVTPVAKRLEDPAEAAELLERHDLVVDATASGPTTAMLGFLAGTSDRPLVSICIQRDGGIVRGDRWPLVPDEKHASPVPPRESGLELREAGCGDPVSPAPPVAVLEAAALGWRMAADILTGRREFPPSVVQVVAPQKDEPYAKLGLG
jgi:hypothetical protein